MHVVKKIHTCKDGKGGLNNSNDSNCGHGIEEIGDIEKEKEFFDEAKKEKIIEILGAYEDEKFVIQNEISWVVEKKKMFLVKLKLIKDHSMVKKIEFIEIDNLFETRKQTLEVVEINYGMDKFVKNYVIAKTNVIVGMDESKEVHDEVETFDGGKYNFVILEENFFLWCGLIK